MHKQCVPGSFFSLHAQEPGNKATGGEYLPPLKIRLAFQGIIGCSEHRTETLHKEDTAWGNVRLNTMVFNPFFYSFCSTYMVISKPNMFWKSANSEGLKFKKILRGKGMPYRVHCHSQSLHPPPPKFYLSNIPPPLPSIFLNEALPQNSNLIYS